MNKKEKIKYLLSLVSICLEKYRIYILDNNSDNLNSFVSSKNVLYKHLEELL